MADDTIPDRSERPYEQIEVERKFLVPRRWALPRLAGTGRVAEVGSPARMNQTATYLDTPGLDLLAAKHTLRRRTGGTDAGWHLKTPDAGEGRRERHEPLGRGPALVPAALRDEIADVVDRHPLVPVCVLRTRRVRRPLLGDSGSVLALLEDDTVQAIVLRDGERIVRWREIELELVDGDIADLDAVGAALEASGLTRTPLPSKLSHALDEASVPKRPETAGQVVLAYLGTQVGVLQAREPEVRADAADAVHKSRVATRRLRSALRSFRPLFDRSVTDPLREEIKWLTGVLGGPRDAEVMRDRLLRLADDLDPDLVRGPVLGRLRRTLDDTHATAHARLVDALDGRRYERLMSALVDLLVEPPFTQAAAGPAGKALPPLVAKASRAVDKTARLARDTADPAAREEAVHEVRKRAKAARYAAEAAGESVGSSAAKIADAWTELQEELGDHQDGVVARQVLLPIYRDAHRAGEDTFTYGVMVEREGAAGRRIEARYGILLKRARKAARKLGH